MDDEAAYTTTTNCYQAGITLEKVNEIYTEMAPVYDQTLCPGRYNGPEVAANEVAARIPEEKRANARIMDVAAGTGRVGILLKSKGFSNIDGLEPSEGMMALLKKTGVYTNTYLEFIGVGQNSVPADTYDALVISGGMGEGHIPVKGIDDMIRMTKPGGFVIIVMRKEFINVNRYKDSLLPYIDELEEKGKWTKIEVTTFPNYFMHKDGIVFTYKIL